MIHKQVSRASHKSGNPPAREKQAVDWSWRIAIEKLTDNMAILDPTSKIIAVNHSWRKFAKENGFVNSMVGIGTNYLSLCESVRGPGAKEAKQVAEGIYAVQKGQCSSFTVEYACHSPQLERWYQLECNVLSPGSAPEMLMVHRNVTERVAWKWKADNLSQELEHLRSTMDKSVYHRTERTQTIIDSALDSIITTDAKDCIESFNPSASKFFGYSAEEAVGKRLSALFLEPTNSPVNYLTDTNGSWIEALAQLRDGTTVPVLLSLKEATLSEGMIRICIVHEITSPQSNMSTLVSQARELSRRNQELNEFTCVASHDLQEPLCQLVAFSKLLPKDLPLKLPEEAQKDLFYITQSAKRMQQLVQDLLTLARTSCTELHCTKIRLEDCVEQVVSSLSYRIAETKTEITWDQLPEIWADPCLLRQIYQNLIGNSIKFSGNKPPRIHLTAENEYGTWVLGVRDYGIGVESEFAQMVFTPFKKLHNRDSYEGTGIGLWICKKAIERHGGRIWIEPMSDEGTHFKFSLDQAPSLVGHPPVHVQRK